MAWLDSAWQKRKKITITGQTGAGTSYQVLLKVGESSGATGEQFDLGSNSADFPAAKDDGGDLRFTAADGTTLLDFWVEQVTGTTPNRLAYIWVEVSADLGSNADIYVYYKNAGAPSNGSNGDNTFQFFDDFNDGSIDTSKWNTQVNGSGSSISESSDALRQFSDGSGGSNTGLMSKTATFSAGVAMRCRHRAIASTTFSTAYIGFGSTTATWSGENSLGTRNFNNDTTGQFNGLSFNQIGALADYTVNTWYRGEYRWISSTSYNAYSGNDDFTDRGNETIGGGTTASGYYLNLTDRDGYDMETDFILVRKYQATEPAFASVTAEETGYPQYSREAKATLPSDATALATGYSAQDYTDVATDDATRVAIAGGGASRYLLHLFKHGHTNNTDDITVHWNGQSSKAPTSVLVKLQIYNFNTPGWEDLDSDNVTGANTDFDLEGTITADVANYYGTDNEVVARVSQDAQT